MGCGMTALRTQIGAQGFHKLTSGGIKFQPHLNRKAEPELRVVNKPLTWNPESVGLWVVKARSFSWGPLGPFSSPAKSSYLSPDARFEG